MKAFYPYLNFDGNTREAMTFYQQVLGGELAVQTAADAKVPVPPGSENRVIHARITYGSTMLMASDTMHGAPFTPGNNVWVSIECESLEEIERIFPAMAAGGTIVMPLADQFWNARFGILIDKFGTHWMMNFQR